MSITDYLKYVKDVLKESWEALISSIPIILNYLIVFSVICGILGITLFFIIFRKRFKKLLRKGD